LIEIPSSLYRSDISNVTSNRTIKSKGEILSPRMMNEKNERIGNGFYGSPGTGIYI
jgi:hypothetical protein